MRGNLVIPIQSNVVKFMRQHWPLISASVMCILSLVLSVGIARGKYAGVEGRVDAIEQTHPDATAATGKRNADELAAMRLQIDRIYSDVSATRVDVARLCAQFGLAAIQSEAGAGAANTSRIAKTRPNGPRIGPGGEFIGSFRENDAPDDVK